MSEVHQSVKKIINVTPEKKKNFNFFYERIKSKARNAKAVKERMNQKPKKESRRIFLFTHY